MVCRNGTFHICFALAFHRRRRDTTTCLQARRASGGAQEKAGRDGSGVQAWSRYWLTSKNSIQFSYRHVKIDNNLIPNGGTINDGSVRVEYWVRPAFNAIAFVQYEQWKFPLLAPELQKNVTASLQLTYCPLTHKR
jgi:hypothetical protein